MARTIQEIYDSIITEKQTLSSLNGLTPNPETYVNFLSQLASSSRVAIWRLFAYIVAVAIYTTEVLWDVFKAEIENIAAQAEAGTVRWYQEKVLDFQYGDVLIYQDGVYQYALIDESLKVVKRCAVVERPDGVVFIKTAKLDNAGLPIPLDAPELVGLTAYMQQVKFAGTFLYVNSFNADTLKLYYDIYYSAELDLGSVQAAVYAAVQSFIANLPFNGALNINKLTDALQSVTGVIDPKFVSAEATYGALPYTAFDREYLSNAGYLEIDGAFPLSSTFNFIAL
jgi:hypothetical protein